MFEERLMKLRDKIEESSNKFIQYKQEGIVLLTDILSCYYRYEHSIKTASMYRGKMIDKIIKHYFEDINEAFPLEVNIEGIKVWMKPDIISNKVIYEVKTMQNFYLPRKYVLQCFAYSYYYYMPVYLVVISDDIEIIDVLQDEDRDKLLDELKTSAKMFKEKIPKIEECENCFFRKSCDKFVDKYKEIKDKHKITKLYKMPFNISEGLIITPNKKLFYAKEVKEERKCIKLEEGLNIG